jgi:GNAT superfamily N-acetyltransferase
MIVEPELTYIDASPEDHQLLTETAKSSKGSWGYPEDWMELWKPDMEVSSEYILRNKVVKVFEHDIFIGFFGIRETGTGVAEIDHLWLNPGSMQKGYGRLIFYHIIDHLRSKGYKTATLTAEPHANGFYDKMGGRVTGKFRGKVIGRYLDVYEYEIK